MPLIEITAAQKTFLGDFHAAVMARAAPEVLQAELPVTLADCGILRPADSYRHAATVSAGAAFGVIDQVSRAFVGDPTIKADRDILPSTEDFLTFAREPYAQASENARRLFLLENLRCLTQTQIVCTFVAHHLLDPANLDKPPGGDIVLIWGNAAHAGIMHALNAQRAQHIVATGQLLGHGQDRISSDMAAAIRPGATTQAESTMRSPRLN